MATNLKQLEINQKVNILEDDLKRRKIESSHHVAEKIIDLFNNYIRSDAWEAPAELLPNVKAIGKRLSEADKMNFVVQNTVKRVLHILREAYK